MPGKETDSPLLHPQQASAPVLNYQDYVQEPGMGEAQTVSITANPRLRLFAMFINVVVLAELCIAMYFAAQDMDRLTPVFFKVFFSLLIPTLIATAIGRRLIAKAEK